MIKRLTALLLGALLVFSASAVSFGLEKSIRPISGEGHVDNAGRSVLITYGGSPARVYYGSSGISIISKEREIHLETNFGVEMLADIGDADRDGYTDFLTCQSAPDYASQVIAVSGKDGRVISDLHLTRQGYDNELGFVMTNCFVQQLLASADGNAIVVYDYNIVKMDVKTGEVLFTYTAKDNIWRAVSAGDVDSDGTEDFAFTMQQNTVGLISGADGSLLNEWHPTEERIVHVNWDEDTKIPVTMNAWDIIRIGDILYVTTEDGKVAAIDPAAEDVLSTAELGAIDSGYLDDLLVNFGIEWYLGGWSIRPTGINDWSYMGFRFADSDGDHILIDCYLGAPEGASSYPDSSWPAGTVLFNTKTGEPEALISLSSMGFSASYLKTCFAKYGETPCIAAVTSCSEDHATVSYYDYSGTLIYQRDVASSVINSSPKIELSRSGDGLRMECFKSGCIEISEDLKTVAHAYDRHSVEISRPEDGIIYLVSATNGSKDHIGKYEKDLEHLVWELGFSAEYSNKGLEFIRTNRDYNSDGINDVLAIANQYDEEGINKASWFMAFSGADGSVLLNTRVKTGETTIDKKKVDLFLTAETLDILKDMDRDGKPELLCGDSIIGSRRLNYMGGLYGGVDAEGRAFNVGDTNGDGLPDYLMVSDKESRLYESRLTTSYGFASVEYRKTSVRMDNDKDLEPMMTSGLLGDIDGDGISEIVLIGKNDQGWQTYRVFSGKTLEQFYTLCPEGITSESESFKSLGSDINGDGWNELYYRDWNWEKSICDGRTGEPLLNISQAQMNNDNEGMIAIGVSDGIYTKPGMGDYHPDYLVPFMPLEDQPDFIMTNDADGDGLLDLAVVCTYYDFEKYLPVSKLVTYSSRTFSSVSEIQLSIRDGRMGRVINIDGSSRYAAQISESELNVIDLEKKCSVASYKVSADSAMQIGEDIIVSSGGELLRLSLEKSFDLLSEIPEKTTDHVLHLSWKPVQDYSVMKVYDNSTAVYGSADTAADIPLMQGEHEITLSMDDGQGKVYSEVYTITVSPQEVRPVLPIVLGAVMLIAALFFGIFRKVRIASAFRRASK